MIDFDNFKDINDRLGHDEGDRFLTQMGGLIREKLRPTDFVCRYGGDEFAVIMPATSLLDGIGIARRLREFTAHFTWKMAVRVSASFGLAAIEPASPADAEEFFKQADSDLYRAKSRQNRISTPPSTARPRRAASAERARGDFADGSEGARRRERVINGMIGQEKQFLRFHLLPLPSFQRSSRPSNISARGEK
jgi:diguanylate cyclase (GGDEF)-like protein